MNKKDEEEATELNERYINFFFFFDRQFSLELILQAKQQDFTCL
jgi:hypothetical protein